MTSDARETDVSDPAPSDPSVARETGDSASGSPEASRSSLSGTRGTSEPTRDRGRRRDLRRRVWLLVPVMALAFGIGGALYTLFSDVTYSASTLVQIDAATVGPNESPDEVDDQEISTQRLVITSDAVAAKVVESLKLDDSVQSVQNSVVAEQVSDSRVLRLTATRDSPEGAVSVANGFAQEYLAYRTAQRDQLLSEAGGTALLPGTVGEVLTPAVAKDVPSGISPLLVIVLSVVLGVLVGGVLAVLVERRAATDRGAPSGG